jgi:ATP-binding cassette, subfamily G (WHITE), member 2, PDR
MPSKILSSIFFNVPLYFMANLRLEAGSFFTFLLFGFTCTLTMSMILRTIGQTSQSVQQALTPAAIFILGLVIYTGFVLPTRSMQGWLRWINYLDPISYAYESLVVNEFSGRQFPCTSFVPAGPMYTNMDPSEMACAVAGALPGQEFIDGDFYLNSSYGYFHSHLWRYENSLDHRDKVTS